ncbi:MAG: FeoA domain-containing protein [Elusimicrobia bacterium]|nr:FeoA domain-containing protein [Elusimicrobiota bacterium]
MNEEKTSIHGLCPAKQEIEEALSIIWELKEKNNDTKDTVSKKIHESIGRDIFADLENKGFVLLKDAKVMFSPEGEKIAKDLIRRQRVAERLLSDVLDIAEPSSFACDFEHILSKEVEESICTLLGHPRQCPHGSPIPVGECCEKAKDRVDSIIIPLSKIKANSDVKIVYILGEKDIQLHKLMSFGLVPGNTVRVHETYPSFIIQHGETQIAIEEEIAKNIFVKKPK